MKSVLARAHRQPLLPRLRIASSGALRAILLALCAVALGATLVPAQTPQAILPDDFAGWTASAHATFSSSQAANFEDAPAAAATDEFGFEGAAQATYTRGADSLHVTAYRMKDPSGGFGEYLYLRTPRMKPARLGERSSAAHGRALVLVGNIVLDVTGANLPASPNQNDDLKALVAAVRPRAETGLLPTVTGHLPARSKMIVGSEHYVLGPRTLNQFFPLAPGDWLEFANGAEAAVAKYRLGGRDATLIVADYPTPQIATQEWNELRKRFNVNGAKGADADAKSQPLFASRAVTLVAIVAGARSQSEAGILLDQVHSSTQLTWDEPTFQFTQAGWPTIIAGIMIGTCVLCVFAVIAGIAFGGVRIVVKRFFPDKVFDRSDHLDILQLGLSSKPIKAGDFYQFRGRV